MPLSKKRDRERKRLDRHVKPRVLVIGNDERALGRAIVDAIVKSKGGALQSISSGIKRETSSTVSPEFRWQDQGKQPIPNCPDGRYREVR